MPPCIDMAHQSTNVHASLDTDSHYKCPTLFLARLAGGWRSLHLYRFAYSQQGQCDAATPLRCYHGSELPYVFGHPRQTPCRERAFSPEEQTLSDAMRGWWSNVIQGGRGPNSHDAMAAAAAAATATTVRLRTARAVRASRRLGVGEEIEGAGAAFWPAFHAGHGEWMLRLDAGNVTVVKADRQAVCAFWDTTRVYR